MQSRKKRRENETPHIPSVDEEKMWLSVKQNEDQEAPQARNPKLEEFLNVMAPSSKSKTWANEDSVGMRSSVPEEPLITSNSDKEGSDDEYQTVSKKRKRSSGEEEDEGYASRAKSPRVSPLEGSTVETSLVKKIDEPASDFHAFPEDDKEAEEGDVEIVTESAPPVSDSDWLRSRTSRLLGLVDDDEFDEGEKNQLENQVPSRTQRLESTAKQKASPPGLQVPDAASHHTEKTEEAQTQASNHDRFEKRSATDRTPMVAEAEKTGRLFIRNLPYSATETELRDHFSSHGEIEEVGSFP